MMGEDDATVCHSPPRDCHPTPLGRQVEILVLNKTVCQDKSQYQIHSFALQKAIIQVSSHFSAEVLHVGHMELESFGLNAVCACSSAVHLCGRMVLW